MTYPPTIDPTAHPHPFPVPPPVDVVGGCPISHQRCGITSLSLQGHPNGAESFAVEPGALAPGAGGRFVIAPQVETFTLQWDLAGHARIEILRLELFRHGSALPIWTKTLDYTASAIGAHGQTQFDGDLSTVAHVASIPASAVAVTFPAGLGVFPRSVLTAEHAPYKLMLSIVQVVDATEVECRARWIYLDVMVHDIRVALGPAAWIPAVAPLGLAPAPAAQAQHYRQTRARALTVATRAALAADLAGAVDELSTGPVATLRLRLTSNTFSKRSDDFYCNTVFSALLERWGDGPRLPLVATLRVRQSDGNPAPVAAGAPALGNIALMWDWESGGIAPVVHGSAQAFVTAARNYKPRDWPHAAGNCHEAHGGKRAAPGNLHFEDLPAATIGAAAMGVVAAAPTAAPPPPVNRPWCHYSCAVLDPAHPDAGTSGVLFIPSRMAGDSYKLRVHLAYPTAAAFDAVDLTGVLPGSIHVDSPKTLQVWRRVEVAAQLYKDPLAADAPNLDWGAVRNIFEQACVEVRAPAAHAAIPAVQYRAACATVFPALPPAPRLALLPAVGQDVGIYGLGFATYANFRVAVLGHMNGMQLAINPAHHASDNAYLVAQLVHLHGVLPPSYAHEDLLIPTRANHALAAAALRDLVLTNLGITNQATYEAKLKDWADSVLPAVCGEHARAQNPGVFGIHLYHFEFLNGLFQQNSVAEASTTVSNFAVCPACGTATTALPPPRGFLDDHKICGNCNLRLDESAHVTSVAPFRYMNGVNDDWSRANLPRAAVLKIAVGGTYHTSAAISIAHEIGHQLGMPHAGPEPVPITSITGGKYPPYHDHDDDACIMSYNFRRAPQLHFCGLCCLRLAGWSVGPSPMGSPDRINDQHTLALSGRAQFNRAQQPAMGAVYQLNPVMCSAGGCGRPFGALTRPRHCGLCGQAFCSDHASRQQPVRNPVVANPVELAKVCDDCHGLGIAVPLPGAIWQPDENAYACHLDGCNTRFSAFQRKHHCRCCGHVFCGAHTTNQVNLTRPLTEDGPISMQYVCDGCNALHG